MYFKDRREAALKLAEHLERYRNHNPIILGFPMGGVETAYYVANKLGAEMAIAISQKIRFPSSSRSVYGGLAEDGSFFLSDAAKHELSPTQIKKAMDRQMLNIQEKVNLWRKGKPLPELKGRTVIITTHGINTGATVFATIDLCFNRNAETVIVAAPISGERMAKKLRNLVDDVVILKTPYFFHRVSQGYRNSDHLPEEEVSAFIDKYEKEQEQASKEKPPKA
jgi:putative phosphoribosyl transferase